MGKGKVFLAARNNKILLHRPLRPVIVDNYKNIHYSFLINKIPNDIIWYKGIIWGKINNKGLALPKDKWFLYKTTISYFKAFQQYLKINNEYLQEDFVVRIESDEVELNSDKIEKFNK